MPEEVNRYLYLIESSCSHYETLCVQPNSPKQLIVESYKYLSKKINSGKHNVKLGTKAFQKLNNAYECLSNIHNRREYDKELVRKQLDEKQRESFVKDTEIRQSESEVEDHEIKEIEGAEEDVETLRMQIYEYILSLIHI